MQNSSNYKMMEAEKSRLMNRINLQEEKCRLLQSKIDELIEDKQKGECRYHERKVDDLKEEKRNFVILYNAIMDCLAS